MQTRLDALFDPFLNSSEKRTLILDDISFFSEIINNPRAEHLFWHQLKMCADNTSTVILATTNQPGRIPDAIFDRFGEGFLINLPSTALRLNLFEEKFVALEKKSLETLTKKTQGFSFHELNRLIGGAAINAFCKNRDHTPITKNDVEEALNESLNDHACKLKRENAKIFKDYLKKYEVYFPLLGMVGLFGLKLLFYFIQRSIIKHSNTQLLELQKKNFQELRELRTSHK